MVINMYMKTTQMAKNLGYSTDFLLNNRGLIFFEDEHYFTKGRRINWKIAAMEDWIENKNVSIQALEILEKVS